ncbi:MAG TPA: hypothetical protein VMT64_17560 [Candidatus Binataceae bacterium]|nr:hypothetical protein [Candidatus Binataceae bacterium]
MIASDAPEYIGCRTIAKPTTTNAFASRLIGVAGPSEVMVEPGNND